MVKKDTKNKRILIGLSLLAVVAAGSAMYVWLNRNPAADQAGKTDQQVLQEQERAADNDPKTDNEAYYRQNQPAPTPTTGNSKTNLAPVITTFEQSDQVVILNATVGEATSGSCTITFERTGSTTISRSVPVVRVTSYYACQEVQIPRSEFGARGEWTATVAFSAERYTGTSQPKKMTIN